MDTLEALIENMQKEELRFFDLYAGRMEQSEERKDIRLLKMIRKKGKQQQAQMRQQLGYSESGDTAWYRLRNRLLDDLISSLHMQHIDHTEGARIMKNICVARTLSGRSAYSLAFEILRKAEKIAEKAEEYQLLDIIFDEYIKLAQKSLIGDPTPFIHKRHQNRALLEQMNRADEILASLNYRLGKDQRFGSESASGLSLLEQVLSDNKNNPILHQSVSFKIKTYKLMSRLLLRRKEFEDLESYLLNTYHTFKKEGIFSKNRHDLKLEMLTWIINTLYSNGKYKAALQMAENLHQAMREHQSTFYEQYILFYCNTLVINYAGMGAFEDAILIIEQLLNNKKQNLSEQHTLMIQINLMYLYYQTQNYRKALRILHRSTLLDAYRTAPDILKIKLLIAELILTYSSGDIESAQDKANKARITYQKHKEISACDYAFIQIMCILENELSEKSKSRILSLRQIISASETVSEDIIDYRQFLIVNC
jgi:tetratricopeptide (TPR) repeat protein